MYHVAHTNMNIRSHLKGFWMDHDGQCPLHEQIILFRTIKSSCLSHTSDATDLWWHLGRGCLQPLRWKTSKLRQRVSWRRTRRRRVWARQCGCCSWCCASSWRGTGPSRWGRAHRGPGGGCRPWRLHLQAGTWAASSCPLCFSRIPLSSLPEEREGREGWVGGATGRLQTGNTWRLIWEQYWQWSEVSTARKCGVSYRSCKK